MDEKERNRILQKVSKGSLTADEQEKLNNWYADFDTTSKDLKVFHDDKHEEKVRIRLLNRIIAQIPTSRKYSFIEKPFFKPSNWMKVAAVLILFVSFPLYNYVKKANELRIVDAATLQISKAQIGKRVKLTLEDGSEILLNSGSVIKYPKHFDNNKREVYLEGEAFFKVTHNATKPFIINTGKLKTIVLGTSFNIRAYPEIDQIKVTVSTGKVSITATGKTLSLLYPNQQINYHSRTESYEVTNADAKLATSWQIGEVRLDGVSFQELSLIIKNTWGLILETQSNRLKTANYKTTFNTNNKIEDVMRVISKITDAKYLIRNNIITLYE
ncbi:FecR family protein [Albibacterium bauzanense]|uniref:FecR family protein n=1 Tax=Albibacterium bauzanense TaxID=653929 RepID=A0A4R1LUB8_9SPHI|nr:FecR family protein [Albibacterium bauzanense]TCK80859.1 FecR family protein [Albibacterium bauzanense]